MKKLKFQKIITNVLAVFFLIGMITCIAMAESVELPEKNAFALIGSISMVLLIVCIVLSSKLNKKIRRPLEEAKQKMMAEAQRKLAEHQEFVRQIGASIEVNGSHTYGLPVAENVKVTCYWCRDKVLFESSGASFNLSFDKLTDVASKLDIDTQTFTSNQEQYVSSIGRAAAGAMVFGSLGAAIGGRAIKKNVKTTTTSSKISHYLVFTYIDNGEVKYIIIEMPSGSALPFVEAFKRIKPANTQSFDL